MADVSPSFRDWNRRIAIFLCLATLTSIIALAQTSQLILRFPDGTPTGLGSTCFEEQGCTLSSAEITKVCQQEGIYSLLFTSHLPDGSTNKFPEKDAHTVNWNSQTYCTAGCTGQNVAFSTIAQFCCGAHRARDCGFRFGDEVCGDTSANTWEFTNLKNNIGDIYQFVCANASIVSNGQDFFTCGDPAAFVTAHPSKDLLPITRGGLTHDYVCAELNPDDINGLKSWIECKGDQDILTRKVGNVADMGFSVQFGTILNKKLSSSEVLEIKQAFNFNPERGIIFLQVKPSWRGTDGLSHTFFEYRIDDDNFIRIFKQSDSTIQCQYRNAGSFHSPASISATGFGISETHKIRMTYDTTTGKVTCTVDDTSTEAGAAGKLATGGTLSLNSARLGSMPGQAELRIRIADILNPNTLYCDTRGKLLSNLDTQGERLAPNERITCEKASLAWTGTKCCSEDDDTPNEFYNDPDPRGAPPPTTSTTGSSAGGTTGGTQQTTTTGTTVPPTGKGSASEGIFFGTGGAILSPITPPSSLTTGQPSGTTPPFITAPPITGMQTATLCTDATQSGCLIPPCPEVAKPAADFCTDGTPIAILDQNRCPTGQFTCSPWKSNTPGTCWNSTYFRNGQVAPGTNDKVMAAQGRWLGCQITASLNPLDAPLLQLQDKHTTTGLIAEVQPCTLAVNLSGIRGNNRVCSFRSKTWIVPTSELQHKLIANPVNDSDKECCPKDSCWNGEICQANQREESTLSTFKGFRCIDGTWTIQVPITTPDGKDKGFCPNDNQCLVNNRGNKANINKPLTFFSQNPSDQPTCIKQGQYILNNICQARIGSATIPAGQSKTEFKARSQIIALHLAELGDIASPNDYSIFCGGFEDVLNFVDYRPPLSITSVQTYLNTPCIINEVQAPCVNSFCAMRFAGNQVAVGTSTNVPLTDTTKSFLLALGKPPTSCANAMQEDDAYHSCGDGIFYNNITASIIKIPPGLSLTPTTTQGIIDKQFPKSIRNNMNLVTSFMERPLLKKRQAFFNQTTSFAEIFISKSASKSYFGVLERDRFNETPIDYIGLAYNGFPVIDPLTGKKPCDMINDKISPADLLETDCDFSNNNLRYVAFSKTPAGDTPSKLRSFWKDLSAKLR